MKNKGFTLAEVLITLTVVGFVAALTLPSLYSNINNAVLEKQTVKFYTQLQEAVKRYMAIEMTDKIYWNWRRASDVQKFVKDNFVIERACGRNNTTECFPDTNYVHANDTKAFPYDRYFTLEKNSFMTSDGMVFSINTGGFVAVDINGKNKPNKEGHDLWLMRIQNDGTVVGINNTATKAKLLTNCKTDVYSCFTYFKLNNFKIDY